MTTAEIIRAIVGGSKLNAITCSVLQVNSQERTCDCRPLNGDADIFAVRLQTDPDATTGFYMQPKVGSNVIVGFLNKSAAYLIMASELDSFEVVIGNTSFSMDGSTIKMNGGSLGGLVKVQSNVSKLNALENSINSMKQVLQSWIPVPNDGGAALKTAITTWAYSQLTATTVSDIENTAVKQ